jgi:hypothetical protein
VQGVKRRAYRIAQQGSFLEAYCIPEVEEAVGGKTQVFGKAAINLESQPTCQALAQRFPA